MRDQQKIYIKKEGHRENKWRKKKERKSENLDMKGKGKKRMMEG